MKEKDIRDRIARFLQKTARTVVVPASMGLGLSGAGCDRHSLHGRAADAGPDLVARSSDAAMNPPDLADAATKDDTATKDDLPPILVPYLVVMVEDAAADVVADAQQAPGADVVADAQQAPGVDADRDAFLLPLDVRADIPFPDVPYGIVDAFSLPRDVGPDMSFPPPPYLLLPQVAGEPLGGAQEIPPGPLAPREKK